MSSVAPLKVKVGATLTIKGTGFRAGKGKTTVVFQRTGKPAVFVKAESATSTKLTLHVPDKLAAFLVQSKGAAGPTTFKLRILAARFSATWTSKKNSPVISPKPGKAAPDAPGATGSLTAPPVAPVVATPEAPAEASPPPAAPSAYEVCESTAAASGTADQDHDGLTNALELSIRTDPCVADSDGDGVTDGYEYQAAKDLNGQALPYPGKLPWPNALDTSDANYDFDGDGLTMFQEFQLWTYKGSVFNPNGTLSSYSDGTQNTGGTMPATGPLASLDLSGDLNLTDDERDADGDGLSNMVEDNYTGTQGWWEGVYNTEKPYTLRAFSELDPTMPDTNGNGVLDGQDDQDNDGVSNFVEMELGRDRSGLRVQPFNPCLPNPHALTCSRWIPLPITNAYPPFDGTQTKWNGTNGDVLPFVWPEGDPSATTTNQADAWDGLGGPQGP
ncbi:MAG TPA: hypothetical protein VGM33_16720 [Baekduia sp.]